MIFIGLAPNLLMRPSLDKQQGLSGIMPSFFGPPFMLAPSSTSTTCYPRIDYSGLVHHDDDDSSIESIEEIPSDYLVDLEENAPSNFVSDGASYVYEI